MKSYVVLAAAVCLVIGVSGKGFAVVPWATSVVSYDYDGDGNAANDDATYSQAQSALGEPSRMGGVGTPYATVVSMFSGPWTGQEVVSVAPGGRLVVAFDKPITNDPSHLHGVDLIVFGNATFGDADWMGGTGQHGDPATMWDEPGQIEVSADGLDWRVVPGASADSLFPTQAYRNGTPYAANGAGLVPSDFLRPVDPALTLADFNGLTYAQSLALYDGSGGGTPVDLASVGLSEARFARVTVPQGAAYTVEVDAFAVVPEPASLLLLACATAGAMRRRF